MRIGNLIIITLALLLSACATAPQSLRQAASEQIETVDQVLIIPQSNLDITVTQTNPGAAGLIGALLVAALDEYRRSAAEEQAAPIIAALQDYDFRATMLRAMANAAADDQQLRYPISTWLENTDSDSTLRIHFGDSVASAVLFTAVRYRLESGNLIINANLLGYPKIDALMRYRKEPDPAQPLAEGNTIYRQTFEFTKQAINAHNIKDSLAEGARSIAHQIVADLSHPVSN